MGAMQHVVALWEGFSTYPDSECAVRAVATLYKSRAVGNKAEVAFKVYAPAGRASVG